MTETPHEKTERPPVGNLTDFVTGVDKDNSLDVDVFVNEKGKVVIFHNRPFKQEISWFEFELGSNRLSFVLDTGETRQTGLPMPGDVSKYMQNSHQILMVLLDDKTGEATQGSYVPLIIHRK